MSTIALKPMHVFMPLHRSTSLHTAPETVAPTPARQTVRQAVAVVVLLAVSIGAPFLTLLTPPTLYASRILTLEHAQDLAAMWQASRTGVGTHFDSPMMRAWLLAPPASIQAPKPGLT